MYFPRRWYKVGGGFLWKLFRQSPVVPVNAAVGTRTTTLTYHLSRRRDSNKVYVFYTRTVTVRRGVARRVALRTVVPWDWGEGGGEIYFRDVSLTWCAPPLIAYPFSVINRDLYISVHERRTFTSGMPERKPEN